MIASAYAARPELLLLDEPASGLTDREIDAIMEHMRRIANSGVTLMIIEHVMRVLMEISSRVVVLHRGRVLTGGAPATIRDDPQVRRLYFGEVG